MLFDVEAAALTLRPSVTPLEHDFPKCVIDIDMIGMVQHVERQWSDMAGVMIITKHGDKVFYPIRLQKIDADIPLSNPSPFQMEAENKLGRALCVYLIGIWMDHRARQDRRKDAPAVLG